MLGKLIRQTAAKPALCTLCMEYQAWGVSTSDAIAQVFLGSSSTSNGVYVNKLQLGPIRADLSATYKFSASDKIDVNFIDIAAYLGPLRLVQKVIHTTCDSLDLQH